MAAAPRPLLEVVIVSYRSRELVLACLESLERHPPSGGDMVVHVVDNASDDGTVDAVRRRFPAVRAVRLDRNVGFSTANNTVLHAAEARYVLVLNPDTELRDGVLDHMVALMEGEPDIGMAGCRLVQRDGTFDHAAKRSFPTPVAALAHFTGIGRRAGADASLAQYRAPDVDEFGVGDVDAVNGAFMFVRTSAMRQVGLFDSRYWLYMEDLDWCRRFHRAGWRVVYDGRVTALHVKGGTTGGRRPLRQNVAFHLGMGRFYRKFEAGRRPALDGLVYCGILAKLAASVAAGAARSLTARRI